MILRYLNAKCFFWHCIMIFFWYVKRLGHGKWFLLWLFSGGITIGPWLLTSQAPITCPSMTYIWGYPIICSSHFNIYKIWFKNTFSNQRHLIVGDWSLISIHNFYIIKFFLHIIMWASGFVLSLYIFLCFTHRVKSNSFCLLGTTIWNEYYRQWNNIQENFIAKWFRWPTPEKRTTEIVGYI